MFSSNLSSGGARLTFEYFTYGPAFFNFESTVEGKSSFDLQLEGLWKQKVKDGCFRYELGDLQTKYLEGRYNFIVQLNIKRATDRRKPQAISDITMPFNHEAFHFGKVPEHEKLFMIKSLHWDEKQPENMEMYRHALIINVSPLESSHSLLVPSIEKCLPQVLNFDALRIAVEVMLVSSNSQLKTGYNSQGAYASVNHLHFHLYYLRHKLFLENAPVDNLEGTCYELRSYPAEGFAFEILSTESILDILKCVMMLIDYLIQKKIAHNVFLTRGTPIKKPSSLQSTSLRIYVWAREAHYGAKDDSGFNLAVCELAGHLPMKNEKSYKSITENEVAECMKKACHKIFHSIREEVKVLFQDTVILFT